MSLTMSDTQLNRAALLIAKLLIRTREGKVRWEHSLEREMFQNFSRSDASPCLFFKAPMEPDLEAIVGRDSEQLGFQLSGLSAQGEKQIVVQVLLPHSYGQTDQLSPESIVYRDIEELLQLAENPKFVSDDVRYKQAMSYLDKLTA